MHCVFKKSLRVSGESPRVFGYKIREKSGEVLLLRKRGWKKQTAATYRGEGKKGSLHGLPFLLRKTAVWKVSVDNRNFRIYNNWG